LPPLQDIDLREIDSKDAPSRKDALDARLLGPGLLLRIAIFGTLLAYAQTINFEFVYDDFPLIVMNPWLSSWHGLRQIFLHHCWGFMETYMPARYYRPVYMAWMWGVTQLFGAVPGWFHLCAVLTQVAAAIMAFRLAKVLLRDDLSAAIACVVFATHPTKAEGTAWISAVCEPLLAVFLFAAVLTYIRWRDEGEDGRYWLLLSLLCSLLAFFTKETAVVLPLILLAYEIFLRDEVHRGWLILKRLLPFLLAEFVFLASRYLVLHGAGDNSFFKSPKNILLSLPIAFWIYVRQLVWPVRLSAFYPPVYVAPVRFLNFNLPLLAVLLLAAVYLKLARRDPVLKFAAVWYLLTLSPVAAAFYWLQYHDRYLTLPSFGAALMAAVAIRRIRSWRGLSATELQVALVTILAVVWTGLSAWNAHFYEDDLTTFTRAVQVAPTNAEAIDLLAGAQKNRGQHEAAAKTLAAGLRAVPNSSRLKRAAAEDFVERGDLPKAEQLYRELLDKATTNDERAFAYSALGRIALKENHLQEAGVYIKAAAAEMPNVVEYENALENLQRVIQP